jgi:IclR helix-turn-helix domain
MLFHSTKSIDGGDFSTLRAFAVIDFVTGAETPSKLDELTRVSGLPKPTAFRMLGLLVCGSMRCAAGAGRAMDEFGAAEATPSNNNMTPREETHETQPDFTRQGDHHGCADGRAAR